MSNTDTKEEFASKFREGQIKLPIGLRIFPSDRAEIERRFPGEKGKGSIQAFLDKAIKEELSKSPAQD